MKRAIVFVMLAVFLVSVMSSTASAAMLGTWVPSVRSIRSTSATKAFSTIIKAVAQFEGTLQAYSVNQSPELEEQLTLASEDLIDSAEALEVELTEIYSTLLPEQQPAFIEAYSSLDSYFEELNDEKDQLSKDLGGSILDDFDLGGMFDSFDLSSP
jgi:ABC-type transporter MlaC component